MFFIIKKYKIKYLPSAGIFLNFLKYSNPNFKDTANKIKNIIVLLSIAANQLITNCSTAAQFLDQILKNK